MLEGFLLANFPCISTWSPAVHPLVGSDSVHTLGCPGDRFNADADGGSPSSHHTSHAGCELKTGSLLAGKGTV